MVECLGDNAHERGRRKAIVEVGHSGGKTAPELVYSIRRWQDGAILKKNPSKSTHLENNPSMAGCGRFGEKSAE